MSHKVAIVTGVSRIKGIGRAICIELAKRKHDIFFTYWTEYDQQMPWSVDDNEPDLIQEEIKDLGVRCEKIELDLSSENSAELLFDSITESFGEASVLVNNATFSTETEINTITGSDLDKHYAVNVKATTLLIAEFVKRFNSQKQGRIVNLTSGQSLGQMPNEIAYAMTKGAIETLTVTLSSQLAGKGITINAVNPGPNDTGWMNKELKESLGQQFPMGRIGQPKDTAKLIGFLANDDAEWITGQIIHSEGGFKR